MTKLDFWVARPTHYWNADGFDPSFAFARRYEDAGFGGLLFFDTQNLAPEVYVALTAVAKETQRLHLGTGVTNPVTRHAAVTASAMSTLQRVSEGRAYLGLGRGDSSLAYLGYAPTPIAPFEEYLHAVQAYLRGDAVDFPPDADVASLHLADQPDASRLQWLAPETPKVPVGIAATGPRVIALAATAADRVDLMLGASPERVRWGLELAHRARHAAGLPDAVHVSAYINLVVHDDPDQAWRMAEGAITSQARFAAMHGQVIGPVSEASRVLLERIHETYDMKAHGANRGGFITADFAHEFGIYGSPSYCVDRLTQLAELGVDRVILIGGPELAFPRDEVRALAQRFATEVLPRFEPM